MGAADLYRRVLLEEGPDAVVAFNLANVLRQLGQVAAAAERFAQAVELDPGFADAWNNLGLALAEQGECEAALRAIERAIALEPNHDAAIFNLAECLERANRPDEARRYWRMYAERDPESDWGRYARSRLET